MLGRKKKKENPAPSSALRHIAFIMDGNGRWAKKRGLPRELGHKKGAEVFESIVRHSFDSGIETVTVYAFSTENWSRPQNEIDAIMGLLSGYLDYAEKRFRDLDVTLCFLGDKARLPEALREKATRLEALTCGRGHILNIALNYGARDELLHAVRELVLEGKEDVTEKDISEHLYTAHCPDPDLIVRTGGDYRISNFLLWQAAYAEFYFTPTLWPDFTARELDAAIEDFLGRHRRFGGL